MALPTPDSPADIERDLKTDFQRELVSSNPFLPNSWISALISGFSNRLFDNFVTLNQVVDVSFYDTSPELFLERQANWYSVVRFPATQSSGDIIVAGDLGSVIPIGTDFVSSDGIECSSDAEATIIEVDQLVADNNLTSIGQEATIVFEIGSEHQLSPGVLITVSGAVETAYNGTFEVNIVDSLTVEYTMLSATTSPATGAPLVEYDSALVQVTSTQFSADANLEGSSKVVLSGAITGVDTDAFVYVDGLAGGSDEENIEDFRERFLDRVRNPVANFNVSAITEKARQVSGVTRVFVQEVTPQIGEVTIWFTRDNDGDGVDILPSPAEALEVKDSILEIKPANTSSTEVHVTPLTGVITNFVFGSILPNTETMKEAVFNSLDEFFKTTPVPETNVTQDQYRTAIQNTVDLETGERIDTFTLGSPSGDIVVNATGTIAVLGTVG